MPYNYGGFRGGYSSVSAADPNADLKALVDVYWKYDEFSDGSAPVTRLDSGPNGIHLTDNNTTPSGTGHVYSNAASFVGANQEFFSHANHSVLDKGDEDFTWVFWINFANLTGTQFCVAKDVTASGFSGDYSIWLDNVTDRMVVGYSTGPAAEKFAVDANFGPLTASTWYMVSGGYDSVRQRGFVRVNTSIITETTVGIHTTANTDPFKYGRRNFAGAPSFVTASSGPVALYHAVLSDSQNTRLWNGGAGLALY